MTSNPLLAERYADLPAGPDCMVVLRERTDAHRRSLPRLSDFPIPHGVKAGGKGWSPAMTEMAEHVGARATLLICQHFGGLHLLVPVDPAAGRLSDIVGTAKSAILSAVYGRERLAISTGKVAIDIARRGGVIAAVRARQLTVTDAAVILNVRLTYVSRLVHQSSEGVGILPSPLPQRREINLLGDAAEIAADALVAAGADPAEVDQVKAEIVGLAS